MSDSATLVYPRPTEIHPPPPLAKYTYPGFPVELSSVYPPPGPLSKPNLPSTQRKPIWHADKRIPYSLTTHIIPTAYLREDSDVVLPDTPGNVSKEERKGIVQKAEERLREIRRGYEDNGRNRNIKSYGYAWEPTLLSLLASQESQSLVQEIWVWDVFNQGDSALLNKGNLTSLIHTRTGTRDLLSFLIYFLPSSFTSSPLPVHLPQVPEAEAQRRIRNGFFGHGSLRLPICCFGHSFGGAISTLAAISHPSLFTSLCLIDPVITYPKPQFYYNLNGYPWVQYLDAPLGLVEKKHAKDSWNLASLDHDVVRLKTPPIQEAITFNDAETGAAEAWVRLWKKELDPRIKLRWVMPGPGRAELDPRPNATQERVWLRPENCSNIRMEGSGHLVAQEKPEMLGKEIGKFLKDVSRSEASAKL
ncbi:hypothetical protein BT96DRAFT_1023475 [Gymnopus androsaceus JB14]|uniref:AB hydrolase-1 domain-containing protein n=1 Tax=Gymnopus androsaceus JB14 TaxID=1447944 RepID=A0A6A4H375_9AGAR|nr:hypothetical protein BT96DRAFT_1023475 [Gymnopus androsaceus JB14]